MSRTIPDANTVEGDGRSITECGGHTAAVIKNKQLSVIHCHILEHKNRGMGNIRLNSNPPDGVHERLCNGAKARKHTREVIKEFYTTSHFVTIQRFNKIHLAFFVLINMV